MIRGRPYVELRAVMVCGVLAAALACSNANDGVSISGDVAGLDSLGFRGDSLFAQAERPLRVMDSIRASAKAMAAGTQTDSAGGTVVDRSPTAPRSGNPMSRRAYARGDSMARAAAMRIASTSASTRSRGDTVRGVLTVIGKAPVTQVVLRTDNGATTIALSGMAKAGLAKLAGSELMIRGVRITPRDVVVSDFVVRAVAGVPAFDGKLVNGESGAFLQLTDGSGRKSIAMLPSSLEGLEGTRVWIAMKPGSSSAVSYGLIGRH